MESGVNRVMQVCCASRWKVTVGRRYLKRRGGLFRVVQMVLLGSILAFLKASNEKSGQVIFLLVMICLVLATVMLIFITNLLPLHCVPRHHHHHHYYKLVSVMETVHDGVSCIILLPAALLLLPPSPSPSIAAAAVLTVVLVLVLSLQCVENLQRACPSNPQEPQGEEEETLPSQDLHARPTRRYTPNARRGRSRQWSKHRKDTASPPIPLLHTSMSYPNSPFLSRSRSSPLLPPPHTSMSHPSSPCPYNPRSSQHTAAHSGVSLTQDVVLADMYVVPRNTDSPSSVDTCPSPGLTHMPGSSPSLSHTPSLTSATPTTQVSVNPMYTVPASTHPTTTYATPYSACDLDNDNPVYENLPATTTTTTNATLCSASDLADHSPDYENLPASNTTTYATPYSPSDIADHSPHYENLPIPTIITTCDDNKSSDHHYLPVSYL